jgi:hypothetical protein
MIVRAQIPAAVVTAMLFAVGVAGVTGNRTALAIPASPERPSPKETSPVTSAADRVAQASTTAAPSLTGKWTGTAFQNKGKSNYTVVMTISASGAESDYPELKCGGKLTRVGASGGYVFFTETITRGGQNSGGGCIDGTVTVAPAGDNLAWGWVGAYRGETFVAWSTLKR